MNHDDVYYALQDKLHDKEARIRELEGRINRADRYLALGSPNGAREALAPPDSEPAEPSNGGESSASAAQGDAEDAAPISAAPSSTPQRRDALAHSNVSVLAEMARGEDFPITPEQIDELETSVKAALSRTSDGGTGCVVPESIRRLSEQWQEEYDDLLAGDDGMQEYLRGKRDAGHELDRAIAQQGGQRVPDRMLQPTVMGAGVSEHAYIKGWNDCREAMLAAAPQPDQESKP